MHLRTSSLKIVRLLEFYYCNSKEFIISTYFIRSWKRRSIKRQNNNKNVCIILKIYLILLSD